MPDNKTSDKNFPAAQGIRLEQMVDYSAGSVISKTLLKNSAGNLTLFSFDKGEGLSEHTAPFDAVVEILDGEAEITIGGKTIKATTGEHVLMPANVPHALSALSRFKMLLIMIRGQ
jgi:quercetin dioxygenase-like cupin family protein